MMKKICIVTVRNIFNSTCLPRYAKALDEFDIIYWDQHGLEEDCGQKNKYVYKHLMNYGNASLKEKITAYLGFRKFAKRIINKNKYDKLIVYPTQTAIALFDLLTGKYKRRWLFDIRDYSGENRKAIKKLINKLVKSSEYTSITSPAYKKFLPEKEYLISNNINYIPEETVKKYREKQKAAKKDKFVISCIGSIRFYDQFCRLIDRFGDDERYYLRFIGRGSESLKPYITEKGVKNVELIGLFDPKDTINYYLETDVVLNVYGNHTPFLDYALSNKLYYSAALGIPILVSPETYMSELTGQYGFGFDYDPDDGTANDRLFEWLKGIDYVSMCGRCDEFMIKVKKEEEAYQNSLRIFAK